MTALGRRSAVFGVKDIANTTLPSAKPPDC